jgi:ParB-like nuclease domain
MNGVFMARKKKAEEPGAGETPAQASVPEEGGTLINTGLAVTAHDDEGGELIGSLFIDEAFKSQIMALGAEEAEQLEANLKSEGCRDPLVVGVLANNVVLLDGHHRLEICKRLGIPFKAHINHGVSTREKMANWIDANQLGRRNLVPEQMSLLRGRLYNRAKKTATQAGAMKRKSSPQGKSLPHSEDSWPEGEDSSPGRTSEVLAAEHGVSRATMERDGQYADAVETLKEEIDPEIEQKVRSGKGPSKKAVVAAAKVAKASPAKAKKILSGEEPEPKVEDAAPLGGMITRAFMIRFEMIKEEKTRPGGKPFNQEEAMNLVGRTIWQTARAGLSAEDTERFVEWLRFLALELS